MCGLVGALSFESSDFTVNHSYIEGMRDTMVHRGPDGEGSWVDKDNRIGLGHRRLSIIDLSQAASQPMSNPEDSIVLVFNGEIYNHAEIRAELEQLNKYTWQTNHSDTEVVLYAFQEWGISFIERFYFSL